MNAAKINQKEYLKKYLANDLSQLTKKKKKKKDKLPSKSSVTIVDDDIDLSMLADATDADLDNFNLGEDLPQIAGIIDERPAELIAKEDYKASKKWKTIGDDEIPHVTLIKRLARTPDASPPRVPKKNHDLSPIRRSKRTSDESPPMRSNRSPDASPPRRSNRSPRTSRPRRSNQGPDESPPRRSNRSPRTSPPRRSNRSPDASPPRRSNPSPRTSPPRRSNQGPDASPPRRLNRSPRTSPPRRSNRSPDAKKSPSRHTKVRNKSPHRKMTKTLDGKIAGLQNAEALREENELFRKREHQMFEKMLEAQKHDNGERTVANRKTGQRQYLHRDAEKESVKLKKEEERKQIYDRWSKGLKQIEENRERVTTEAHEMNKPMARYEDDEDLENYQRRQYREGDPMAAYFRKKESESNSNPCKPIYKGSFPENRFGIRPGYRWDGVNRSNGYESKWFDMQNQKKATAEEAYKYSVEDM